MHLLNIFPLFTFKQCCENCKVNILATIAHTENGHLKIIRTRQRYHWSRLITTIKTDALQWVKILIESTTSQGLGGFMIDSNNPDFLWKYFNSHWRYQSDLCNIHYETLFYLVKRREKLSFWKLYTCQEIKDIWNFKYTFLQLPCICEIHLGPVMIWCLIVRCHKVSKPRDLFLELYDHSGIWQAPRQQNIETGHKFQSDCIPKLHPMKYLSLHIFFLSFTLDIQNWHHFCKS